MTAEELVRMLRLLAGLEAILSSEQAHAPDYLLDELNKMSEILERELVR